MIPLLVTLLVKWGYDEPTAFRYARLAFLVIVGVGILAVVFTVSSVIDSCGQRRAEQRIRKAEEAISKQTATNAVATEQVNATKVNVNSAEANVNAIRKEPVTVQPSKANDALRRFECEVEGKCK